MVRLSSHFAGIILLAALVILSGCYSAGAERPHPARSDSFTVRLEDVKEENVFRLVIGPVDVPLAGHGDDHHHHGVLPEPRTVRIPKRVSMTGFRYAVLDADGNELPSDILHHMNVIKPDYRELFLPISQRMLALGKETGEQSLPWLLFGHPLEAGTQLVVSAMLHNPLDRPLEDVSVVVTLEYVDGGRPWPLWDVYPFQLDVQFPAGEKAFDLPPGDSEFSYTGSPSMEGRIIALGSHLHDYATDIRLEDVTTGELIWQGYPITSDDGVVSGITVGHLYRKLGKKIYPDHEYRVAVRYHNPTPDTIFAGGMGVVAGAFVPSDDDLWPRADTTDQLYRIDRLHYLRKVSGSYEELVAQYGESSEGDHHRGDEPAGPGDAHNDHSHHGASHDRRSTSR